MALSHQTRIGQLAYVVDTLVSPLLQAKDKTDNREVLELALLESFLWIRTGTALGLFPAQQAMRAVEHTIQPILPAYEVYAGKKILTEDIAGLFAEYLRSLNLREEGEASIEQRNVFMGALDSSSECLGQVSVCSFIHGLHWMSREDWHEMLNLPLQESLIAAAAEGDVADCNELTQCAAGAILALEHMIALESLEGYGEPALLNMLRRMRNWCFNLHRDEAHQRCMLLMERIQERANTEAGALLDRPIALRALTDTAAEQIEIWQRSVQTAYPYNFQQQIFSKPSLNEQKPSSIPEAPLRSQGSAHSRTTPGIYFYEASAFGLAGELTRPAAHSIPAQAASVLSSGGGRSFQRVENFHSDGIVSFQGAYTEAGGSYDDCHDFYTTYTFSVVERLNIADMVTADRIVSRLSVYASAANANDDEPSFDMTGSYFENLRIAGQPIDASLATHVFHQSDTYSRVEKNIHELEEWVWGSQLHHVGESELRDLEETYHSLTGISRLLERRYPPKRTGNGKGYLFGVTHPKGLERSELKDFGSIICVPKFGVIRLAELQVKQVQRRLDMLRVDLEGTAQGTFTVGATAAGAFTM